MSTASSSCVKCTSAGHKSAGKEVVEVVRYARGQGRSKDVRSKAFEPFFTTKQIGKGSGLGLSQVAKQSGGGVRIPSEMAKGTTIEIFLPDADVR